MGSDTLKKPARAFARAAVALAVAAALPPAATAHEGHDHDVPAAAAPLAAAPRFAAASDAFELVGVLEGRRLTLWLDRFADNAPVTDAGLELEIGGRALAARAEGDRYVAELPEAPAPGTLPVTATVLAGQESDLLAADLVVGPGARVAAPTEAGLAGPVDWRLAAGGAALVAAVIGWFAGRRRG